MNFKDFKLPTRGYFKIECLNEKGEVVDKWEEHNLITDVARAHLAKLIGGIKVDAPIVKFRMGTAGHCGTDYLAPKDEDTGFTAVVTDLFCKTIDNNGAKGQTWDEITFTPSGSMSDSVAKEVQDNANNNSTINIDFINFDQSAPTIQYTINVAQDAFNGQNDGMIYTEAGLYTANDTLIAIRTFKGKIKDSTTAFRITWNIIF